MGLHCKQVIKFHSDLAVSNRINGCVGTKTVLPQS